MSFDAKEYQRKYRAANKARLAEYNAEYRKQHREQLAGYYRSYRKTHSEKCAAAHAKWVREHPEKVKASNAAQYAKKRAKALECGSGVTNGYVKCAICGRTMTQAQAIDLGLRRARCRLRVICDECETVELKA